MTEEKVKFGLAEYKGAIAGLKFTSMQTSPNARKQNSWMKQEKSSSVIIMITKW